jgi:predicted anti-sigma-YlaC factor YlaD
MTSCTMLSDRMPAVAGGRDEWTADEAGHLAMCEECRAEWELVRAVADVGRDLGPAMAPEAMSALVLDRVREARHRDARRRTTTWSLTWGGLAVAAAVMLAVLFRGPAADAPIPETLSRPTTAADVAFHVPLPELDDADSAELQEVLDGLDAPLGDGSTLDAPLEDDVTRQDMERMLRAGEA